MVILTSLRVCNTLARVIIFFNIAAIHNQIELKIAVCPHTETITHSLLYLFNSLPARFYLSPICAPFL